eukprot:m.271621 g.271621  ORF g.271621 m.271621 type:complete len:182 (+) comp96722_c0_seq1:64-609(+)
MICGLALVEKARAVNDGDTLRSKPKGKKKHSGKMSQVLPELMLGNRVAADELEFLLKHDVSAVANVGGGKEKHADGFKGYLRVHVPDSIETPLAPHFHKVTQFIHTNICEGGKVFVHCRSGIHRSPAMVAAYLIMHRRLTADQAMEVVSIARPIVNFTKHHTAELETLHNRMCASNLTTAT